jgi:predicted short-subunit dehydrogenase-like oxidoreductase (DUF2520 family)
MYRNSISFAGAGRVAEALCKGLYNAGIRIDLIVSETSSRGKSLAASCNSEWSPRLIFPDTSNVIIVAVPDHKLKMVLESLKCAPGTLVAHTAGSIGLEIFPAHIRNRGVFYPLQTFSKDRNISFADLPFLLESSDNKSSEILNDIAMSLGSKVYFVDTEHRRLLHVAAVFACNFPNHMLTISRDIASRAGFQFEILAPLIQETISKALTSGPQMSQTGPAVRYDQNTIETHLELLSFAPDLQKIYGDLTRSIMDYYKDKSEERKGERESG